MKTLLTLLIILVLALSAWAASVTLAWDPSPDASVTGYRIYYGVSSGVYTNSASVGNVTNATIAGLVKNRTYYFAATAYDTNGNESVFSNETSYSVPSTTKPRQVINIKAK